MNTRSFLSVLAFSAALAAGAGRADAQLLRDKAFTGARVGKPQIVGTLYGPVPVGVVVARGGRMFVSFPRTINRGPLTLGEVKNGRVLPFPNRVVNTPGQLRDANHLVAVQGITLDRQNRLWALDAGKISSLPIKPGSGAAKLVCIDLRTNSIIKTIAFPADIAGENAYLNDVRIASNIGTQGTAFITDSSEQGPNGIVVVDLATGKSRRRLNDHPSTKAEQGFVAVVEGQQVLVRKPGKPITQDKTGVDGLALSGDGATLYYCPNAGHHLYSVSTKALADASVNDEDAAATVKNLGNKGFASDGLEADAQGRLYLTDYENDAIRQRNPDGTYKIVVRQPTMVWPDSIAVVQGGYLYYTSNQLNRRTQFHYGKDLRRKPYVIYRVSVPGATPQAYK